MINKAVLCTEIKEWKNTHKWSKILKVYITEIIEVCISSVGADLPREDTYQELWLFVILLLPKINTRKNSYAYLHTCIRHYISDLRERHNKHRHINMEDVEDI